MAAATLYLTPFEYFLTLITVAMVHIFNQHPKGLLHWHIVLNNWLLCFEYIFIFTLFCIRIPQSISFTYYANTTPLYTQCGCRIPFLFILFPSAATHDFHHGKASNQIIKCTALMDWCVFYSVQICYCDANIDYKFLPSIKAVNDFKIHSFLFDCQVNSCKNDNYPIMNSYFTFFWYKNRIILCFNFI